MPEQEPNPGVAGSDAFSRELYDQLKAIAHVRMLHERAGHTLQTTALVHEALMRMTSDGRVTASARPEFFRNAAESMRRILIDHARTVGRDKRGGGMRRVPLDDIDPVDNRQNSIDILTLDEAICRLEKSSPDAAAVVRLRFYAGLTVDESAEAMNVSPRTVDRLWLYAPARLWDELKSGEASRMAEDQAT